MRRFRRRLTRAAGRLLPRERVGFCGARTVQGQASVRVNAEGCASYGGVMRCGLVWLCPSCAAKIAEGRRREVSDAIDRHMRMGGHLYMAALTVRHDRHQSCAFLKRAVACAWRWLIAGSPWLKGKAKCDLLGMIRALEVTHGENGWHPHLHVLFLFEPGADPKEIAAFGEWIFERWQKAVRKFGIGSLNRDLWRFEVAASYDAATDYVTKWGCDEEITKGMQKLGRKAGRSPWQLLADAMGGDKRAGMLFREYADAFKGARQLTWTRGLKALFEVEEHDDAELAAIEERGEVIGYLPGHVLKEIDRRGLYTAVLDAAETGGWPAVLTLLRHRGLIWLEAVPAGP